MQRPFLANLILALFAVWLIGSCTSKNTSTDRNAGVSKTAERPRAISDGTPLGNAAAYLWNRQGNDGGWHSETYGLLKSGQALTPFVLYTLLNVPDGVVTVPEGAVNRALEFIRRHATATGVVGVSDPEVLEYPVYSTAYSLLCLVNVGSDGDQGLIARMRDYLLSEQFTEQRGFDPTMLAYGGWGFGGTHPPGETGHMDLAHTRRALEALHAVGVEETVFHNADFLMRLLQKHPSETRVHPGLGEANENNSVPYDGGFYFSPIVLSANKGRVDAERGPNAWRSYATATCDGILSMLDIGISHSDQRVLDAVRWLQQNPRLDYPDGIPHAPEEHPEPWGEAVRFYHYAVRAECYDALDWQGTWQKELEQELSSRQRDDGSFVNLEGPLMKEDDPVLCTALAVTALSKCDLMVTKQGSTRPR